MAKHRKDAAGFRLAASPAWGRHAPAPAPGRPETPERGQRMLVAAAAGWLLLATGAGLATSPVDGYGGNLVAADDLYSDYAEPAQQGIGSSSTTIPDTTAIPGPGTAQVADEVGETLAASPDAGDIPGDGTGPSITTVPVAEASLAAFAATVRDAPPQPVRLVIPDVGIDMQIGPVGIQEDGQMAIPDDVDDVGWYKYGAAPGASSGTAVLASHVDSWAEGVGPFARLRNQVTVGMRINVYSADGSSQSYRVSDNRMIPKPQLPVDTLFSRDGSHRLVLVTCGGRFQRDVGHYTDNIVVTADPVGA